MQIILSEAAKLIRQLSGYYIDTRAVWYKCRQGTFKFKKQGVYYTVSKKSIIKFAESYKGNLRGPLPNLEKLKTEK
jgi:hypothetical protein